MKNIIVTTLAFAGLAFHATAEGLNTKQIPANAQWIAHVDVDGFKASELGKFTMTRLKDIAAPIDAVAAMLQFDPRKDLSDITAYGQVNPNQPENGVAHIRGKFNPEHLRTLLKANESLKTEKTGKHELLSWKDEKSKQQQFGSIVNQNLLVVGSHRKLVSQALATVDGKGKTLDAKKLKDLQLDPNAYIVLGMATLEGLPIPPQAKMLENVKSVGLTFGERNKNLEAGVHLLAANEEFATQIQQMLQGFLAIAQLQAGNAQDAQAKEAAQFLKDVKIEQKNKLVRLRLAVPVDKVLEKARMQFEAQNKKPGQEGRFKVELGFDSEAGKDKKKD